MRYRKSCVTGAGLEALRVVGTGWATSWWPKSTDFVSIVATWTGGRSVGICDGSGNAASTIDSGSYEATILPVAIPVADSAAVATSVLATEALPIAVAFGASPSSALAVRDAARSSIGTAPVFSMRAESKPASQATIHPARTIVPHNAATVADRRGLTIPRLQRLHLSHAAQPSTRRPDYSGQDMTAEWRKLQVINFSKECCPNATWRQQAVVCILRRSVQGEFRTRRARHGYVGPTDAVEWPQARM